MDFNPAQHAGLFAALLLLPGLAFLFTLVVYLAFIGRDSVLRRRTGRTCLKCGRTLLPEELACPDCPPQDDSPTAVEPGHTQPPELLPSDSGQTPRPLPSELPPQQADTSLDASADSSPAYQGELIEESDDLPAREHD